MGVKQLKYLDILYRWISGFAGFLFGLQSRETVSGFQCDPALYLDLQLSCLNSKQQASALLAQAHCNFKDALCLSSFL